MFFALSAYLRKEKKIKIALDKGQMVEMDFYLFQAL